MSEYILITSDTCKPCKPIQEAFEKICSEADKKCKVVKVETPEALELFKKRDITKPTTIPVLIKDDQVFSIDDKRHLEELMGVCLIE